MFVYDGPVAFIYYKKVFNRQIEKKNIVSAFPPPPIYPVNGYLPWSSDWLPPLIEQKMHRPAFICIAYALRRASYFDGETLDSNTR